MSGVDGGGGRAWRVLTGGADGDVVLAVDLFAPGRAESSFADLAALLGTGRAVWETVQPRPGQDLSAAGPGRASFWADGVWDSGRRVSAVLGYCVGGVYAAVLAERFGALQGDRPRLLLFDPEPPTPAGMLVEFHSVLDRLAGMVGAAELAELRRSGERAAGGLDELGQLEAALVEVFGRAVRSAFARAGLDGRLAAELAAMFASVMSYFAEAGGVDHARGWASATALCSRPPTAWARLAARAVCFDVTHGELLRSPAVARDVERLLARDGPGQVR